MNIKRYIFAVVAVLVLGQIFDYVEHGLLLSSMYQQIASTWRPDMMDYMWVMMITAVLFSLLFVYIFTRGYEGKGLFEGVRYGALIGLLFGCVGAMNQWAVYPIPFSLAALWAVFALIRFMIYGIVIAAIYKK